MNQPQVSRFPRGRALVTLALLVASGCSKATSGSGDVPCVQHGPAFRLELRAADGPIPRDTKITVSYQGGLSESFKVNRPATGNEDVCCRVAAAVDSPLPPTQCGASDAGLPLSDAASDDAVLCDVWSNGAATLYVAARGYEPMTTELVARTDPQCQTIVTSEVRVLLSHGDGGVGGHHPH